MFSAGVVDIFAEEGASENVQDATGSTSFKDSSIFLEKDGD